MADQKKFLDAEGVKYLWSKINMQDYPNNETLMGVIEAIDETKADKSELFSGSWNDLIDKPFIGKTIVVDGSQVDSTSIPIAGYRKVSDYVPSKEELLGGSIKYAHNSTATTITEDNLKTNNYYISGTDCLEGSYFLVVPKDTGNYKKGIYYRSTASYNHILTFTSNKTLDANKVRVEWDGIDNKPEQYPTNWDLVENKPEEFISSWEKVNNKPLNHISKATISEPDLGPNVGYAGISLDDFYHLSGVMPTLEDFSEGYDVITFWPVETIHYDSSTVLTGDYFDSGFYNVYDSNGQFIIFYEDGNLSDGRDVRKGTYLNTNLITSLIVKPQTVLDPVQIKVDWDGVINKPNFALKEEFHKIAQSGSWNDLEDKPFYYDDEYITVTEEATYASGDVVTTLNPQLYHHYSQPGTYIITYDSNTVFEWNKNGGYYNFGDDSYEEYPLQIKSSNPSQGATVYFKDEQPHLLKVEHIKQVAVPMDENFIPNTIARKQYVDSQIKTHTHTFDSLTDKPFYENITYKTLYQSYGTSIPGNSATSVTSNTLAEGEYYMRFNNVNYPFFITSDTTKIGPSENFPFTLERMRSGQSSYTWVLQSVDKSTSFTYALVSVNRDIKQLDKKFIPTEIVNKVDNSLTNDDIVIIEVDEIFPKSASSAIKAAVDDNKIIVAKVKTVSGKVYTTTQVSYTENSFSIVYPVGTGEERLMVWDDTVSYSSSFISQSVARKLKTWDEEKSGDTDFYPSINAMEEYVTSKIESMNVTPEDIIEWMTEESAIAPLASTSGQLYVTNDNKILII